jgi:hypothetical protein
MNNDAVWATVENVRQIFAIVLALSLSEAFKQFIADRAEQPGEKSIAFKQFIADRAEQPGEKSIRWDSLLALLAFLLLLIPFYHGMARYLYDVYRTPSSRPQPYSASLLFDVVAFTVEAGLFFVMSCALRLVQWRRFYWAVVIVLCTDTVWGTSAWLGHRQVVLPWLILNAVFLPILIVTLLVFRKTDSRSGPIVALVAMAVRTVLDYATAWSFYFPS